MYSGLKRKWLHGNPNKYQWVVLCCGISSAIRKTSAHYWKYLQNYIIHKPKKSWLYLQSALYQLLAINRYMSGWRKMMTTQCSLYVQNWQSKCWYHWCQARQHFAEMINKLEELRDSITNMNVPIKGLTGLIVQKGLLLVRNICFQVELWMGIKSYWTRMLFSNQYH